MSATDAARGTLVIPEAEHRIEPTPLADIDAAVEVLAANAKRWVDTTVAERIAMIEQAMQDLRAVADEWTRTAAAAKGIGADSLSIGEDWGNGVYPTMRNLRLLRDTLRDIAATGRPQPPGIRVRPDGQVVVDVLPKSLVDKALFIGWSAEVRIQPGVDRAQVEERLGRIYREGGKDEGGVATVLGAGNVSSIPAMDVLYKLFAEDRVCLLKMNPVNEHVGPYIERAFKVFVDAGFLRVVYGGAEQGIHVCQHPDITEIHITGSDKTHDAIVYGGGEEGARRKAADDPINTRHISSELGNVSPVIVVPGPWSSRDIALQAENLASQLTNNGGFNCIATRMIITHSHWNRRGALLDGVRASLASAEQRMPYYPGARDRWQAFTSAHPEAETFGDASDGKVPWTLIADLDPTVDGDIAMTTEAFCGVFGEVGLDAPHSVVEFIEQAVAYANDRLWGTLAATIVVHPKSLKDPEVAAAIEKAIDDLRYGTVAVNVWSGLNYLVGTTTWGGYPGHQNTDIQSGRGVVHNTYLIEDVEKSVLRTPFRSPTKPWWFHTFKHVRDLAVAMTDYELGDVKALARVTLAGLRG